MNEGHSTADKELLRLVKTFWTVVWSLYIVVATTPVSPNNKSCYPLLARSINSEKVDLSYETFQSALRARVVTEIVPRTGPHSVRPATSMLPFMFHVET